MVISITQFTWGILTEAEYYTKSRSNDTNGTRWQKWIIPAIRDFIESFLMIVAVVLSIELTGGLLLKSSGQRGRALRAERGSGQERSVI